jgi:hypothetical protein
MVIFIAIVFIICLLAALSPYMRGRDVLSGIGIVVVVFIACSFLAYLAVPLFVIFLIFLFVRAMLQGKKPKDES